MPLLLEQVRADRGVDPAAQTDDDAVTGAPDFTILIEQFGNDCRGEPPGSEDCAADCTGDAVVGSPDFDVLFARWGNRLAAGSRVLGAACN